MITATCPICSKQIRSQKTTTFVCCGRSIGLVAPSPKVQYTGPELWAELHTTENPTPEWFADWVAKVKQLVCNCGGKLDGLLDANPPRYDDWFCWSVELHNAVNVTLNRSEWTIQEAEAVWL